MGMHFARGGTGPGETAVFATFQEASGHDPAMRHFTINDRGISVNDRGISISNAPTA